MLPWEKLSKFNNISFRCNISKSIIVLEKHFRSTFCKLDMVISSAVKVAKILTNFKGSEGKYQSVN